MGFFKKIFGWAGKLKQNSGKIEVMSPADIWFTTPTISNEFPQVQVREKETVDDIYIHEDDYRQIEFLKEAALPEIMEECRAIRDIWENHSKKNGGYTLFSECHVRRSIGSPNLAVNFNTLVQLLKTNSTGQVIINGGVLVNGFAVKTMNAVYFGILDGDTVSELCIFEYDSDASEVILGIIRSFNLVLVDWVHCRLTENNER